MNKLFIVLAALVLVVGLATSASAIDATLNKVSINDYDVELDGSTVLSVSRGSTLNIDLALLLQETQQGIQIRAQIPGSDNFVAEQVLAEFDGIAGTTYRRSAELNLPHELPEGAYTLTLFISTRADTEPLLILVNLIVEPDNHALRVRELLRSPAGALESGEPVLARARLENIGARDEQNVRVTFSLGGELLAVTYVDILASGEQKTTQEVFGQIPCDLTGEKTFTIDVDYNALRDRATLTEQVRVNKGDSCSQETTSTPAVVIIMPQENNTTATQSVESAGWSLVKSVLEVIMVSLLVIFVIIAIIVGIVKLVGSRQ